mgnify:FL=1
MGNSEMILVDHEESHILNGFQRDLYTKKHTLEKLENLIDKHPHLYGFELADEYGETLDKKLCKKAAQDLLNHHIKSSPSKKYKQVNITLEVYKEVKMLSIHMEKSMAGTFLFLLQAYKRRVNEYLERVASK